MSSSSCPFFVMQSTHPPLQSKPLNPPSCRNLIILMYGSVEYTRGKVSSVHNKQHPHLSSIIKSSRTSFLDLGFFFNCLLTTHEWHNFFLNGHTNSILFSLLIFNRCIFISDISDRYVCSHILLNPHKQNPHPSVKQTVTLSENYKFLSFHLFPMCCWTAELCSHLPEGGSAQPSDDP